MTQQKPAPRPTRSARAAVAEAPSRVAKPAARASRKSSAESAPVSAAGFETHDGATVWRLNAREALVETLALLPPIVDDPHAYGAIAAAHAIAGVYALGARPLFARSMFGFPAELPPKTLKAILRGGSDKAAEAGIAVLGGHSSVDPEPEYGLAVTGVVHPGRVLTRSGGQAGDVVLLTRPVGSGILATAHLQGLLDAKATRRLLAVLGGLDRAAGELFASRRFRVHALAQVSDEGLLGDLLGLARGAGLRAKLHLERLPLLEGVPSLAAEGIVPAGTATNLERVVRSVRFPKGLPVDIQHVLAAAQINGGLLAAVPPRHAPKALAALEEAGVAAAAIGELVPGRPGIDVE